MASTPLELIGLAAGYLKQKGIESARLDAEVLLSHALGVSRLQLYLQFEKPLESQEIDAFRDLVRRRARREPTAYILGTREFWSLGLLVDPRVLIPRPETERLVDVALEKMGDSGGALRFLDLGTGSGAVALALLSERPSWSAVGVDASPEALVVAEENARRLGLAGRFEAKEGSLFAPVAAAVFELLVANPPYIPSADLPGLEPEVFRHEPRMALDGGADGLDVIRAIAVGAPQHLVPGGWLALEFGAGQAAGVRAILSAVGSYADISIVEDFSGWPRVAAARRQ